MDKNSVNFKEGFREYFNLDFIKGYSKKKFYKDFMAGLTVGIIALPQALAFSMLANLPPEWGIYAAIVAGLLAAIFGGSEHNVTGPTSALAVVLSLVVITYGQNMVLLLAIMVGIVQIILAFAQAGSLVKFIPQPVLVGFSTGVAFLIFASQFPKLFDVSIGSSESFVEVIENTYHHMIILGEGNLQAFIVGISVILVIFLLFSSRKTRSLPIPLIALLVGTLIAIGFGIHIKTIGEISSDLPSFTIIEGLITIENIKLLLPTAIALGFLASVESLATAQIASKMTGVRFNSNRELLGQGIGNFFAGFFKGIPSTGSFSRTAANVRSGAQTRVAAIIHAFILIIVVLLFSGYLKYIPMAVLAGLLITVAIRMIEIHHIKMIFKSTKSDMIVFIATLVTTLVFNIITAIEVGMFFAVILALRKASDKSNIKEVRMSEGKGVHSNSTTLYCPQAQIIQLDAPLFFGIASNFEDEMREMRKDKAKVIILRFKNVPYIDASGIVALEEVYKQIKKKKGVLIITGANKKIIDLLKENEIYDMIGKENFVEHTHNAIALFYKKYRSEEICLKCKHKVFYECK